MNKIDGKYAVVTGSTQGLGAAIAEQFAKAGAAGIITCGRSRDKGEKLATKIKSETGCVVHFVQADLSSVADCRKVIAQADKQFGNVDILVNAAGLTDRGDILNTDEELFDRMFAINTRGPFFLMQDAIKLMIRESTQGAIVNIGSTSAMAGQPFISAYCASKGALATLTKNTAYATLRNKIRVNQLNIGWMASDGEHEIQTQYHGADENWLEKAAAEQPFERLLAPQEVAIAVTFLASKDAGMMTGSVINFDQSVWGGYSFAPPTPDEPLKL
ncbi:MAG: short-chain dehydrogenase [Hyphomicrobiales bacterium]|nr:MAG: short-chain dehydrogenase [Hyphomicrobiales bacterium]